MWLTTFLAPGLGRAGGGRGRQGYCCNCFCSRTLSSDSFWLMSFMCLLYSSLETDGLFTVSPFAFFSSLCTSCDPMYSFFKSTWIDFSSNGRAPAETERSWSAVLSNQPTWPWLPPGRWSWFTNVSNVAFALACRSCDLWPVFLVTRDHGSANASPTLINSSSLRVTAASVSRLKSIFLNSSSQLCPWWPLVLSAEYCRAACRLANRWRAAATACSSATLWPVEVKFKEFENSYQLWLDELTFLVWLV